MSEIEKCPTCGSAVKMTLVPTLVNGPDDAAGKVCKRHYEPLGLDALERESLEAAVAYRVAHLEGFDDVHLEARKQVLEEWWASHATMVEKLDQLLAARAAHVGKEAGE